MTYMMTSIVVAVPGPSAPWSWWRGRMKGKCVVGRRRGGRSSKCVVERRGGRIKSRK
jgi:hypothetical protein